MSCIAGVHIWLYGMVSYARISSPPLLAPGRGDPILSNGEVCPKANKLELISSHASRIWLPRCFTVIWAHVGYMR